VSVSSRKDILGGPAEPHGSVWPLVVETLTCDAPPAIEHAHVPVRMCSAITRAIKRFASVSR
jgi:hypothetical protein